MPANRLGQEQSPYLLQHAHNPVDWYPWGEAAFAKARQDNKPIFLSIGYSTCHWCHVMERESFSDPGVAAILNDHFVSIKVDREERPDIDALYMQAVTQMTGQGGWPLTVFLTPDLKPFYGGTYFPPADRWGRPGLTSVLHSVVATWRDKRHEIVQAGEELTRALQLAARASFAGGDTLVPEPVLARAVEQFANAYDERFGGLEGAPKFPRSHALTFLLRAWWRTRDVKLLAIVEHTLQAMAAGGLHDQLGGGFHRYSTDAVWRIPHFEKMLYDQALLARTYVEAYQITRKPEYARTARGIFDYCLSDLAHPEGGWYSAEDADSARDAEHPEDKGEGLYYLWTLAQLTEVLGPADGPVVAAYYGVEAQGNAIQDPTGEFRGRNVLYRARSMAERSEVPHGVGGAEVAGPAVTEAAQKLLAARGRRPPPHLDDKILTDWTGLMIASLALGGRVLGEPRYLRAAERAAQFVLTRMVRDDGRLWHRWRGGQAGIAGTLGDYAFLIHGLIELYEATFESRYLVEARRLLDAMLAGFGDDAAGGLYLTASDAQPLLVRQREYYDGAIPSGNSMAALELIRICRLVGEPRYEARARQIMESVSGLLAQHPTAYPQLLVALEFLTGPSMEIVLAGNLEAPEAQGMRSILNDTFLPGAVAAWQSAVPIAPWLSGFKPVGGRAAAYVCRNHACERPVTDAAALERLLSTRVDGG